MKTEIVKINIIDPENLIRRFFEKWILKTDMKIVDDYSVGDFDLEYTTESCGGKEIFFTCSGSLITVENVEEQTREHPTETTLVSRYFHDIDIKCFFDGEQVEFTINGDNLGNDLEKLINV